LRGSRPCAILNRAVLQSLDLAAVGRCVLFQFQIMALFALAVFGYSTYSSVRLAALRSSLIWNWFYSVSTNVYSRNTISLNGSPGGR